MASDPQRRPGARPRLTPTGRRLFEPPRADRSHRARLRPGPRRRADPGRSPCSRSDTRNVVAQRGEIVCPARLCRDRGDGLEQADRDGDAARTILAQLIEGGVENRGERDRVGDDARRPALVSMHPGRQGSRREAAKGLAEDVDAGDRREGIVHPGRQRAHAHLDQLIHRELDVLRERADGPHDACGDDGPAHVVVNATRRRDFCKGDAGDEPAARTLAQSDHQVAVPRQLEQRVDGHRLEVAAHVGWNGGARAGWRLRGVIRFVVQAVPGGHRRSMVCARSRATAAMTFGA